jgi:glyoxylase-like metal-dependent hydrolase (beta-lactamase superfamily II)
VSDDYTGHAQVGGAILVRRLPGLTIAKLAVGPMDNNSYLLRCTQTDEGLLIDAAAEPQRLAELSRLEGPPVSAILTTHKHADHWGALEALVLDSDAAVYASEEDAPDLPVAVDEQLGQGDILTVGDVTLEVIHLRGHTPGSLALLYRDPEGTPHLFTGDALFPGGVGKTWSPEDFDQLLGDVVERVFEELPDETWFYPGHGNDSTIGTERPHLAEWRARGW